ncbi:MAG: hypothetical protein Q9162_001948 [Coniocarpon cinnabarinum]
MAARDQQRTATGAHADTATSSTPVEMAQLNPSHQQHDEPVSPMTPGFEQFSTPPTSARHSTFGGGFPGLSAPPEEEEQQQQQQQTNTVEKQDSQEIGVARTTPLESSAQTDGQDTIPQKTPQETNVEKAESPTSPIQPTTTDRPAIGPATSQSHLPTTLASQDPSEPALQLIILLVSGARHPFTISESFLQKRGISSAKASSKKGSTTLDPYGISGYTLKELIWRDWRDDWETRPSSPGGIRLISLGRLVDDNKPLSGKSTLRAPATNLMRFCRAFVVCDQISSRFRLTMSADYFSPDREATMSNHVVHMTVKPADMEDDDGAHKKRGRASSEDGERRSNCCCCSVM